MGGAIPKQFLSLRGRPLLDWSLSAFQNTSAVSGIVLVLPTDYVEDAARRLKDQGRDDKIIAVVAGGEDRQISVARGLKALPPTANWVAVHDAVRPFVTPQLIEATFTLAQQVGAAIPVVAIHDTLVQVDENGRLLRPISRDAIKRSQTPQIFSADLLADSHERAAEDKLLFTDDATLVAYYGHTVGTFVHHGENRKITTPADMEKITMQKLGNRSGVRCGSGYDAHRLVEGRPLILGGVRFPSEQGLLGHSDADVICHAICDALLGAAALGDIGRYFPDTDPAYKDASSLKLLEETSQMVREKGYEILFVDTTLVGEMPRIGSRREEMREKLAHAMSIDPDCVSVKATTQEGMGFVGRSEGLAAMSVATIQIADQEEAQ
jgi:2-C-methyl-D-erythritol 2,4-cyclodiphosphate synthase/2-C-methyl-D-erythritol 4-phosphate cytidylyltransferase